MKHTSLLALILVYGFPIASRGGHLDAAVSSAPAASRLFAREVVGGFPCDPEKTQTVELRFRTGSNAVQIVPSNRTLSVHIGDCVKWKAVAVDGKEKPAIVAINVIGQNGRDKSGEKRTDVCDHKPTEQCLIAIGLDSGEYNFVSSVSFGGKIKVLDPVKFIIVNCVPPNCMPVPFEDLVTGKKLTPANPK